MLSDQPPNGIGIAIAEAPSLHRAYGSRTRRVGWLSQERVPRHSPNRVFQSMLLSALKVRSD